MFRSLLKIRALALRHPRFSFSTIPILNSNLGLDFLHPSKIHERFLSTVTRLSPRELLTYIDYFAQSQVEEPSIWDSVSARLENHLDNLSYPELSHLAYSLGFAGKYDEKFWRNLEGKFLENLYVDEDSYGAMTEFLGGMVARGHAVSGFFAARFLDFIETNGEIKGNERAVLAHLLARMKGSLEQAPKYKAVLGKVLGDCIKELKYLDFAGLGELASGLILANAMSEELRSEIVKNMILVDNTITLAAINSAVTAFSKSQELSAGKLGKVIMSYLINVSSQGVGKSLIDVCFAVLRNDFHDEGLFLRLKEKLVPMIDALDGREAIKVGFCFDKLNVRDAELLGKLRTSVLSAVNEIRAEELVWVYEGFAGLLKGDAGFWEKIEERLKALTDQMKSEDIKTINNIKDSLLK